MKDSLTLAPVTDSVLKAIGRTPVVQLKKLVPSGAADVFVKLEYYNPTGSYKDRMALAMIEGAEARGALKPGMRVVEYTGGSTGSSLAMVCAVKGYAFAPLSSDAFAREKIQTMEAFGATVEIVPSDGGKVTPALFDRFKARIAVLKDQPGTFWTDQFNNTDALNGYRQIGVELLEQVGSIDAYCGGVGTAGMLVGVSRALRAGGSKARIVALEPTGSPVLTTGKGGAHRVEGIAAGFVPPHLKREDYDEVRAIDEEEARNMARRLAREEGIFAGTSSGLNVVAALQLARELGAGRRVATVAVDTGLKYLAGDLFQM
jgi:cysteine synthase A